MHDDQRIDGLESAENPTVNPYQVTMSLPVPMARIVPLLYWLIFLLLTVVGLIFFVIVAPFGILFLGAIFFGSIRSVAYLQRIRSQQRHDLADGIRRDFIPFMLTSLAMGFAANIACVIAFVATCLPLGFGLFSIDALINSTVTMLLFICILVISGVLSMMAGWFMIRLSLPQGRTG